MIYVFLTLAWLLPNHYLPWVNFHSESAAFFGLGFLLLTYRCSFSSGLHLPPIAVAALSLAVVPWVQYFTGLVFYAGDAFISSFYVAGFALAVALGFAHHQQPMSVKGQKTAWLLPAQVLLSAAGVSALLAFLQWLSLTGSFITYMTVTDIGDRAMANLGQPNQLGTLLLMGLAALVLMFELFKAGPLVLSLGAACLTWAMVLTESRTAILSAFTMSCFLMYKLHQSRTAAQPMRLQAKFIALWWLFFILVWQLLPIVNEALLMHDSRGIKLLDNNARTTIWLQTFYAIAESPWFGYGWNQTSVAQAAGAVHYPGDMAFGNAHNIILDVIAWVGLPLGLLITVAFLYWLLTRLKAVRDTGATYAAAILLPFLVHSLLEYPFAYAYFLLTAGLLIGIVEAAYSPTSVVHISRRVSSAALILLTVLGGYAAYEYVSIEEDYRVARFENLRVGRTEADYVRPDILIHTQLRDLLAALRQPAVRDMDKAQLDRLRKVSLRFALRPLVFRHAIALGLNNQPAAAAQQMWVFRGMFGEDAYQHFKSELRNLQAEKYPELANVSLP